MASVVLDHADIALFSDPAGTRQVLHRLQGAQRAHTFDQTQVLAEGYTQPTAFRGAGSTRQYDLTARYLGDEHDELVAVLDLFRYAHETAADGRLQIRTHVGAVPGLDRFEVVMVAGARESLADVGAWDLSFTATTVAYTLEV